MVAPYIKINLTFAAAVAWDLVAASTSWRMEGTAIVPTKPAISAPVETATAATTFADARIKFWDIYMSEMMSLG